ncbi:MAG TPA: molybdopterin converting factor subunit 1 [Vicinamibacterales bacterium]|nr:molybdopterin converting factor subunit 1 [Vicinamibacterales bacterium]
MHVSIRLFARLRELAGADEIEQTLPAPATAQDAWDALARERPALAPYARTISCAVNETYARLTTPLKDGDVVAFLPPVSGGCGIRDAGCGIRDEGSGMRD